jgi:hypothetical protein
MDVSFTSGLSTKAPDPDNPSTTCVPTGAGIATAYTCLDLVCFPTSYAGRTLTVQVFDTDDGSGDIYEGIAEAGVGTADVTYPGLSSTYLTTIDGDTVVHARWSTPGGYNAFNGIWVTAAVTLPSSYTGNCQAGAGGTGWWQLIYASSNGSPRDVVAMKATLAGSPVHLLAG